MVAMSPADHLGLPDCRRRDSFSHSRAEPSQAGTHDERSKGWVGWNGDLSGRCFRGRCLLSILTAHVTASGRQSSCERSGSLVLHRNSCLICLSTHTNCECALTTVPGHLLFAELWKEAGEALADIGRGHNASHSTISRLLAPNTVSPQSRMQEKFAAL